MLLRTTKKFFQETVESFKSFISGGYQRLPKSPPCNSFPCGDGCGIHVGKYSKSYTEVSKPSCKNETSRSRAEIISRKDDQVERNAEKQRQRKKKIVYHGKRYYDPRSAPQVLERERNTVLVAKKLKELEMMDNGNVEHVLDVEEVLHYYSMLTLPAYVDIVDQFFMDVYSELLSGRASSVTSRFHSSRPMIQRVGI